MRLSSSSCISALGILVLLPGAYNMTSWFILFRLSGTSAHNLWLPRFLLLLLNTLLLLSIFVLVFSVIHVFLNPSLRLIVSRMLAKVDLYQVISILKYILILKEVIEELLKLIPTLCEELIRFASEGTLRGETRHPIEGGQIKGFLYLRLKATHTGIPITNVE